MNKIGFLLLAVFAMHSIKALSQESNNLSLTNRNASVLDLCAIYTAGAHTEKIVDNSQWINYSIKTNPMDPLKSISASVASGSIPQGVEIYLEASHDNGFGWGKTGRPSGKIKLDNNPKVIISEIGTCNTGHGKLHGHKLTISIVVTDFTQLQPGNIALYIQYTLNQ